MNITIYGASSPTIDPRYLEDARLTGECIALAGATLVCGGGRSGMMAAAIEGCHRAGGHTLGVLPQFMIDRGWQHPMLERIEATMGMHPRKERMLTLAHGVIALAGGVGTLEELLEAITWRQLGLYSGNIVILDTLGYYRPLLDMLQQSIDRHFMNPDHATLWQVAHTPGEAVELALRPTTPREFTQKISTQR